MHRIRFSRPPGPTAGAGSHRKGIRRLQPLLLCLATACTQPQIDLPPGTLLVGEAASFQRLLEQLQELSGTPLAELAHEAAERIGGCEEFAGSCKAGDACSVVEELACRGADPDLAAAHRMRGEFDWLFARTDETGQGLVAWGRNGEDGTVEVEVRLSTTRERSLLSLLLPSEDPPGPSLLSHRQALVHARLRPDDGLSLAPLVETEGWGDRLFKLQSDLFVATTLAGTWELAIYQPAEGQLIPPAALALDFLDRERAVSAMERFLAEVQRAWPVRRSPYRLSRWEGACLSNLNLLPELAPCYVATDEALVAGWNPLSLELALEGVADRDGTTENRLALYLDRFPEADARLALASGAAPTVGPTGYPWRQALLTGSRVGESYRWQVQLLPLGGE